MSPFRPLSHLSHAGQLGHLAVNGYKCGASLRGAPLSVISVPGIAVAVKELRARRGRRRRRARATRSLAGFSPYRSGGRLRRVQLAIMRQVSRESHGGVICFVHTRLRIEIRP